MGCTKSKESGSQQQNPKKQINNAEKNNTNQKQQQQQQQKNKIVPSITNENSTRWGDTDFQSERQNNENNQIEIEKKKSKIQKFSKSLKYKKIVLNGENNKICLSKQDLHQYILTEPGLDMEQLLLDEENTEKKFKIGFKILNFDDKYNMFFGIAHNETMEMTQFFKKKWFDEIDHGVYAIDDFGNCFSNTDENYNNVKNVGWGYSSQNGCIIQIEVNVLEKKLVFKKVFEQKEYKEFEMPFDDTQVRDEGILHFFVCMGGQSQVQIVDV